MPEYPVDIPDSARAVKANYPTRPSEELVREIKTFIADNGTPFLWPGHTHTRPPQGAIVVYCGEFDLPKSHAGPKQRAKWAPCPCCHSETAWYWKGGKIAWFPDESVVRNIGRDCFRNINESGHATAVEQFKAEERNRKDRIFLLSHLGVVPEAVRVIERALATVRAFDDVRFVLSNRLTKVIGFDLWNEIRADGVLMVHGERLEQFVRPDGTHDTRMVPELRRYGAVRGYAMLNPKSTPLAPNLEKALAKLRLIDFGENFTVRLERMDDDERHRAANSLAKPIDAAKDIFTEVEDCRRFLSAESIATLNGWGRESPGQPRLYFELVQGKLLIGRTSDSTKPMTLGNAFWNVLGELPKIGNIREV